MSHETGWDLPEGDLQYENSDEPLPNWRDCSVICMTNWSKGCVAFTWNYDTGKCALKETINKPVKQASTWSSVLTLVHIGKYKDHEYEGRMIEVVRVQGLEPSVNKESVRWPVTYRCPEDDGKLHWIRSDWYTTLKCDSTRGGASGTYAQYLYDAPTWQYCAWLCLVSRFVNGTDDDKSKCNSYSWDSNKLQCNLRTYETGKEVFYSGMWSGDLNNYFGQVAEAPEQELALPRHTHPSEPSSSSVAPGSDIPEPSGQAEAASIDMSTDNVAITKRDEPKKSSFQCPEDDGKSFWIHHMDSNWDNKFVTVVECSFDRLGGEMRPDKTVSAATWESCANACLEQRMNFPTEPCVTFVWYEATQKCALKDRVTVGNRTDGAWTGVLQQNQRVFIKAT